MVLELQRPRRGRTESRIGESRSATPPCRRDAGVSVSKCVPDRISIHEKEEKSNLRKRMQY